MLKLSSYCPLPLSVTSVLLLKTESLHVPSILWVPGRSRQICCGESTWFAFGETVSETLCSLRRLLLLLYLRHWVTHLPSFVWIGLAVANVAWFSELVQGARGGGLVTPPWLGLNQLQFPRTGLFSVWIANAGSSGCKPVALDSNLRPLHLLDCKTANLQKTCVNLLIYLQFTGGTIAKECKWNKLTILEATLVQNA